MKTSDQIRARVHATLFAVVAALCASTAAAQDGYFSEGARPKVSSVVQASYNEPDPAPNFQRTSATEDPSGSYLNRRFGNGGPAQRMAMSHRHDGPSRWDGITVSSGRVASSRLAQRESDYAEQMPSPQGPEIVPTPDSSSDGYDDGSYGGDGYGEGGYGDEDWDGAGPVRLGCALCRGEGYSTCDSCCNRGPCGVCLGPWLWENLSIFSGVQGFKGPVDRGVNGNFGFHEGVNWAIPIFDNCGIGGQAGFEATQSDLSGVAANESSSTRKQYFTTAGLFHRPCGQGLQYGVVWDHLSDETGSRTFNLSQVRTEVSLIGCNGHEIGFMGTAGTSDSFIPISSTAPTIGTRREAVDQYAGFYRKRFCNGSQVRIWGGATSDSEGIVGASALAPLGQNWAVQSAYAYRIPQGSTPFQEQVQETWGLSISLVWYPDFKCRRCCNNPFAPLFNVADNTTFLVNQRLNQTALQGPQ